MKRSAFILKLLDVNQPNANILATRMGWEVRSEQTEDPYKENIPSSPSIIEDTPPSSLLRVKDNSRTKLLDRIEQYDDCCNVEAETLQDTTAQLTTAGAPNSRTTSRSSSTSSSSSSSSNSSTSSSLVTTSGAKTTAVVRPSTEPSTSRLRPTTSNPSYRISPLRSDESDAGLSDSDPTFYTNNGRRGINISSSGSSSSSSDSSPPCTHEEKETIQEKKKSRKRKRNPGMWKQNKAKILRNAGSAYVTISKSKKSVAARSMKRPCTSKCRLKCSDNVKEHERQELFKNYWGLASLESQRAYIRSCMVAVAPRYRYTNAQNPRLPNNAFYFTIESQRIRVCKLFFINTLDITDRQLRTVKQKTNSQGFLEPEMRGKHQNHKQVNPELKEQIKTHINSIPRIESHYVRATTSREYICESKTIKELCSDFNNGQKVKNLPQTEYWLYLHIFNTEYNIGFFSPKKDRCETCVAYELAPESTKLQLKPEYEKHLLEKELCRKEKREDRDIIDESHICAVYDLQSVMLCPSPDYFYYCSKMNCLNFTITELKNGNDDGKSYGDVHCYFWDETQGHRGANEIGSCVFDYLRKLSTSNPGKKLHVTFYSDNCTGQNKNKIIASVYSYSVTHFQNIESITHKYLIKGHTQNEADNVHSVIEKEIKRNEKSGPIYIPIQFATLIKSARKSGKPFILNEISYEFFMNLKDLQEQWAYNFNENLDKQMIVWNDIKIIKFEKREMFQFYYKKSYTDEIFCLINMRPKRKKMLPYEEIVIHGLYEKPLGLKENKKKDLKDLVRKNLIPSSYATYYDSL